VFPALDQAEAATHKLGETRGDSVLLLLAAIGLRALGPTERTCSLASSIW
jgi:hypothetical protein